jgi:hypothetical protein
MDVRGIVVRFSTKAVGLFNSKIFEIILGLTRHYTGYSLCLHLAISICLEMKSNWSYTLLPLTFVPLWGAKRQLYASQDLSQEIRKCLEFLLLKQTSHVFDSYRHKPAYKPYSELQNVMCLDRIHLSKSNRQTPSAIFFKVEINTLLNLCLKYIRMFVRTKFLCLKNLR